MHQARNSYSGFDHAHYAPPPPIFENTASTQELRITVACKIRTARENLDKMDDPKYAGAVQKIEKALEGNYDPNKLKGFIVNLDQLLA